MFAHISISNSSLSFAQTIDKPQIEKQKFIRLLYSDESKKIKVISGSLDVRLSR